MYLVSKSANLGVWDIQNGCIVGGRCDRNLGLRLAELKQTLTVWSHWLVGNCDMVVVTWRWGRERRSSINTYFNK